MNRPGIRSCRLLAAGLACGLLAGCTDLAAKNNRKEAEEHWSQVRGQMKLQVAREHLRAGRLAEAESQITDALALDPKSPAIHILAARVNLEKGELAAARNALHTAIQLGGETTETDYLLGILAEWSGDQAAALKHFDQGTRRGDASPAMIVAQAEALVALGRTEEALALIRKQRSEYAGHPAMCLLAGDIHTMLGQYDEAVSAYRELALACPGDVQAQIRYGSTLARSGRWAEAIRTLGPLFEKDTELPWPACLALGRSYLELGNPTAAREVFERAGRQHENEAEPWTWLARTAIEQDDLATARDTAERACRINSQDASQWLLLGHVYVLQGDSERARVALATALDHDPQDWLAHYLMGELLDNAGKPAEAAEH